MKSQFSHIQYSIDFANLDFYKNLMKFLGWAEMYSDEKIIGFTNGEKDSVSMWFSKAASTEVQNHHDIGLNHIGINVKEQKDVNEAVIYLKEHNIAPLYSTPRHRPEFTFDKDSTYYQVMFETPDKILVEIMYTGKKE